MKFKNYIYLLLTYFAVSCTAMDEHYKDFVVDGPINYIGKVDSVDYRSGIESVKLMWKVSPDPATKLIRIYWMEDGIRDSVTAQVLPQLIGKKMELLISNIKPGNYSFQIVAFDNAGNKSVPVELNATSLHESILETLWPHTISSSEYKDNALRIEWGQVSDTTYMGSTVVYRDNVGNEKRLEIKAGDELTIIEDYKPGGIVSYFSSYMLPRSLGVLNSREEKMAVKQEYSKDLWIVNSSGYDEPSGRGPELAIDNKAETVWHMSKEKDYPHSIEVDMQKVHLLTGLTLMQRQNLDGPIVNVELLISQDGINWKSQGEYILKAITANQYLAFEKDKQARFFKIIAKSDTKGGKFTAVSEVGAYVEW